jgi:hypothetical protein
MAMGEDLKRLRLPLVIAVVLIAISAGVVMAVQKWTEQARREQAEAQAALAESRGRLARAREEESEIKRSLQQYRELVARGIVGDENRLEWIERINAIRLAHKLYDIRAEISEQKKLDNPAVGPDIMVSRMDISMPLLHEDDLFKLLTDLRASSRGYFQVKTCNLDRGPPVDRRALAPTLTATCELDFYTIRERVAAKVAGS